MHLPKCGLQGLCTTTHPHLCLLSTRRFDPMRPAAYMYTVDTGTVLVPTAANQSSPLFFLLSHVFSSHPTEPFALLSDKARFPYQAPGSITKDQLTPFGFSPVHWVPLACILCGLFSINMADLFGHSHHPTSIPLPKFSLLETTLTRP